MTRNSGHRTRFAPGDLFQQLKLLFVPGAAKPRSKKYDGSVSHGGIIQPCAIELDVGGSEDALRHIRESLFRFNISKAGQPGYEPLNLILRDGHAKTAGGLVASTYWGWLHVDFVWVDEAVQRKGFGRQLLLTAEKLAARRKCHHAYLETYSFQDTLSFYERLGYVRFGVIEGVPTGHRKYFLCKTFGV
jgi:GNAT superfamily N-acetyltransferase